MKCQHCEKPATFHITELTGPQPQELHLCEDHAREYLQPAEESSDETGPIPNVLKKQLTLAKTAEDLAELDQRACPQCGITFREFRQQGRLGCPHDYEFFEKELEPLLVNIHGDKRHTGKRPRSGPSGTQRQSDLIRLKREMQEAVEREDYELAARLRDQIRNLES